MPTAHSDKLSLTAQEIHLWMTCAEKITDQQLLARYPSLLTAEERERQQRFHFEDGRHAALVTRAFVRDALSAYAPVQPEDWRFVEGEHGKPEIIDPPLDLRFNLSHTKGMIICAVTLGSAIGCDVENLERQNNLPAIAASHFSAEEQAALFALGEEDQPGRFFDFWTLKESWIKARGSGIFQVPLQDFSFTVGEKRNNALNDNVSLSVASHINERSEHWQSCLVYPGSNHRIAISSECTPASQSRINRFRFFESIPLAGRRELHWKI